MLRVSPDPQISQRRAALESFRIVDTETEPGFDEIVTLAAQICRTPVALVSLIEENRQWFKARVGVELTETPISQSICVFALAQDDILVIPDLSLDPRTRDNPLVTDGPRIRFYAGAQLRTSEGVAIGSLCVLASEPRPDGLSLEQSGALRALARQVMTLLELRRALLQRDAALEVQRAKELDLRRDADRHQAMFALHRKIDATATVATVLRLTVDSCLEMVPHADGAVIEFREADELVYHAVSGRLAEHLGHRLPVEHSLSGLSVQEGRTLWTGDAMNDPRIDPAQAALLGLRSGIVVPIARQRDYIGVLKVISAELGAFSEHDVETVQLLAAAAAAGFAEVGEAEARRHAEASESRYRTIFESASDFAIIALDLDARITNWNTGAQRIFGWMSQQMIGQSVNAIFTPDDCAANVPGAEMEEALSTGRCIRERWHLRKDGTRFWARGEMMTLRSEEGTPFGFVKMLRDRTAQREAEEGLRKNEERLAFAFDAAGTAGWWDWDLVNDRVYASSRFADLYGVDPDHAASGIPIASFVNSIDPRDRAFVSAAIENAVAEGSDFAEEYRLAVGEEPVRWVFAKGRCYRDASGPLRFPGVAIDITSRKETERLQSALLTLGDRLRDAGNVAEIARAYGEVTADALGVCRAGFATYDAATETALVEGDWVAPEVASIAGSHRLGPYGTFLGDLKRGKMVVLSDIASDRRTAATADALAAVSIAALINAPIIERGELAAIFFVHDRVPRQWLEREVTFIRETADRTQAALARLFAEERQSLLNQELSHRMKNTLAMVQGIATQTMRNAGSLEAARDTLASRLVVFGKAHDILLSDHAESTGIRQLMDAALSLHDDMPGRILLHGPDLPIGRRAALSLALMLHELATNATKYGALSGRDGHIDITWTTDDPAEDPELHLEWRESGGPEVQPPSRRGFGSRLIERGLAGSLGGKVTLDYEPTGLVCRVAASLTAIRSDI